MFIGRFSFPAKKNIPFPLWGMESIKSVLTTPQRLVDASQLLEILFDEKSRPSVRWLREQTRSRARSIPYLKIGRRIFFDPVNVKAHLEAKAQKEAA